MRFSPFLVIIATGLLPFFSGHSKRNAIRDCRQCLVVLADDWHSYKGTMQCFERKDSDSPWRAHNSQIPVSLGATGLAWGRGLISPKPSTEPIKREGDQKAPAGIFFLGEAFGFAPADEAGWIKLPYRELSADVIGVDDPRSRYYNQLIVKSQVAKPDWQSSEQMYRGDIRYKWGLVVAHNMPATRGAGSCIFFHIWKEAGYPTVGCTAMSEDNIVKILQWLDPTLHPLLVQMPRAKYSRLHARWNFPDAN